jgi:D-3-phosphoglycerate dehydrogenase
VSVTAVLKEKNMYTYNCLNPISDKGLELFSTDYKKVETIGEADAVLVRSAAMHDIELGDKLSCVARAGAGVNNIPLDKCAEEGIVVFNTPGANANGVKELVFAGMLLASRDIVGGINWVLDNKDDENIGKTAEKAKKAFAGTEIAGKKLGVIGLGAIGVKVANDANRLGMEVLGYDPYISVNAAWNLSRNVKHVTNVEDIYRECDFITVHVPLLDATKGMINKEAVQIMKKGVVILNFARDLLVDEKAVLDGIEAGKVRNYVTDFANPTVAGKKGVICTPHLGASTEEAEDNCAVMAVKEVMDYMENGNITHSVNYPDCDMGVCTAESRVAILHKNKAGLIASFTTILSNENVNVDDMTNKSRGDYAYTLLDLGSKISDSVVDEIAKVEGVIKVRVVK